MKNGSVFGAAIAALVLLSPALRAQRQMTLDQTIEVALDQSVSALQARSTFVSRYWQFRSYKASLLPSLSLYGDLMSFDRSLRLLQNYNTGEMVYTDNYNLQNSLGLALKQNVSFTGGTIQLYTDLSRIDQFSASKQTWYAQPVTFSYRQPLFSYNAFKWEKLTAPKEYEKAKRSYLETRERITINSVKYFYALLLAQEDYSSAISSYESAARLLEVARERVSLGSVTRDECLQLELRALNDSIAINEKAAAMMEAQMQLNSHLGYDESVEIQPLVEDELPAVMMDFDFVLDRSLKNSSFSLDNEIKLLDAESSVAQAKASRGISMTLNARFGLSNSAEDFRRTYQNLLNQEVVGLSFSVPIFDWGQGEGRVKRARAAQDVVKAQVQQSENDYRRSVFTLVAQFNNQRQQCYVSRRAREIADERYELVTQKFLDGRSSVTELNTAQNEKQSSLRKYISDLSLYWNYYYSLRELTLYDFIAGSDLDIDFDRLLEE
ncbi:MAG: TolC family protein [Bacteroidales bacterium]|nr:TolC family protein [Bacteroidales bacterium]